MITLTLADDHDIVRDLLRYLLEAAGDIKIMAMASDGQEAVVQAVLHSPRIAVLDISMPVMDGIEATAQIRARCPQTHVLILSMYQTSEYIHRCLQAGALGYILKDMAGEDLVKAVHSLSHGKQYFSKQIARIANLYT